MTPLASLFSRPSRPLRAKLGQSTGPGCLETARRQEAA